MAARVIPLTMSTLSRRHEPDTSDAEVTLAQADWRLNKSKVSVPSGCHKVESTQSGVGSPKPPGKHLRCKHGGVQRGCRIHCGAR
eukprot:CAMPEP_0206137654 /NCGR_PEP_ID=MMETSP1473-20131121/2742_1 /ASSEMBLY_ACC=CAM_ASM_001109 /TAXON_ID=1461547 /ORGANISM="Stichococcus sp, Strain RCC1054" /LENGTH=84 /DNA_ID=CAMNT_0053530843 /DNA_START=205 /DNA_END=455 /DNA_ORIENTATION=+